MGRDVITHFFYISVSIQVDSLHLKNNSLMRFLVAAAVVFMLFVLPAGSWWYLSSGYNYRKSNLEQLEVKGALEGKLGLVAEPLKTELITKLKDKVTVLVMNPGGLDESQQDVIDRIADKYGDRDFFQVVENHSIKLGSSIFLVDRDLQIRNTYNWDKEDVKKLVEHTAIMLPIPKRQTISLKRDLIEESNSN